MPQSKRKRRRNNRKTFRQRGGDNAWDKWNRLNKVNKIELLDWYILEKPNQVFDAMAATDNFKAVLRKDETFIEKEIWTSHDSPPNATQSTTIGRGLPRSTDDLHSDLKSRTQGDRIKFWKQAMSEPDYAKEVINNMTNIVYKNIYSEKYNTPVKKKDLKDAYTHNIWRLWKEGHFFEM